MSLKPVQDIVQIGGGKSKPAEALVAPLLGGAVLAMAAGAVGLGPVAWNVGGIVLASGVLAARLQTTTFVLKLTPVGIELPEGGLVAWDNLELIAFDARSQTFPRVCLRVLDFAELESTFRGKPQAMYLQGLRNNRNRIGFDVVIDLPSPALSVVTVEETIRNYIVTRDLVVPITYFTEDDEVRFTPELLIQDRPRLAGPSDPNPLGRFPGLEIPSAAPPHVPQDAARDRDDSSDD